MGGEKSKLKLNSAQLELELGLSLAIKVVWSKLFGPDVWLDKIFVHRLKSQKVCNA